MIIVTYVLVDVLIHKQEHLIHLHAHFVKLDNMLLPLNIQLVALLTYQLLKRDIYQRLNAENGGNMNLDIQIKT